MTKTKGIIYIATGKRYVREAIKSAASLRKHMPHIPITLFSDQNINSKLFNNIKKINNPLYHLGDRFECYKQSPYEYTIFLDTDTYICDDISELFVLLERFDIALAPARMQMAYYKNIPKSFGEFNGGVIAYKKSKKIHEFIRKWERIFLEDFKKDVHELYPNEFIGVKNSLFYQNKKLKIQRNGINDQPSLREALYNCDLRIATLTTEYNCKGYLGFANWKVKILHLRNKKIKKIAEDINKSKKPRIYEIKNEKLYIRNMIKKPKTENFSTKLDRIIGLFGLMINNYCPRLYRILKKIK